MIILTGHPKTGNTWCRFIIFNYFNILKNNASKTLTYDELINIDNELWNGSPEYPQVFFTHVPKNRRILKGKDWSKKGDIYKKTSKIIYVLRNPFDTMISYFYYLNNRDHPFNDIYESKKLKELQTLDGFIHHFLPQYINHVKSTLPYANVIVKYEQVKEDPDFFFNVLKFVYGQVDEKIARKTIDMSSFDSIKQMGITTGRTGGLASSFRDHFTRDGRVGQYKEVMNEKLINYIQNECDKNGIKTM